MRFGMTGVLLLDEDAAIDGLFYGPHTYRSAWVRAGLEFDDGRKLILHDPRRLARCEIDPDLSAMGPDALTLTRKQFSQVVHVARGEGPAIKARLLDQSVVQNNSTGAHSTQWTSTANALVQSNPSKYSYVSNSNLMPGEF